MTTSNNGPETPTPIDQRTVEFENLMKAKFPKIWLSCQEGTLGDNELWLFDLCRMAFFSGWDQHQQSLEQQDESTGNESPVLSESIEPVRPVPGTADPSASWGEGLNWD